MFEYLNYEELKKIKANTFSKVQEDFKIEQFVNTFLKIVDVIDFTSIKEMNVKQKNILDLTTDSFFIIKEIIDNVILKNVYSTNFGMRNLLERVITIKFLNSKDYYTNEVFYDYGRIKLINISLDNGIEKFEKKYNVKFKRLKDNQWIDIVNKYNKWNNNSGFASIKSQTIEDGKETNNINRLYKYYCNFCHISHGAMMLNYSIFLDEKEHYIQKMKNNVVRHLAIILREMILENYYIKIINLDNKYIKILFEELQKLRKF